MAQQPFRLGMGGNIFGGSFGRGSIRPGATQKTPSSLYGTPAATPYNSGASSPMGPYGGLTGTPTFNPNYVNGPLVGMRPGLGAGGGAPKPGGIPPSLLALLSKPGAGWVDGPHHPGGIQRPTQPAQPFGPNLINLLGLLRRR